jgi:hypothetical protein
MPTGMPSIGESGRPARHRSVEASAALRPRLLSQWTKAPTVGSNLATRDRHRSSNARGVSVPVEKCATAQ